MLLVPLLPVFARLSAPEQRTELIARIRQGVMLSNASMLPLGALMVALAARSWRWFMSAAALMPLQPSWSLGS